MTFELESSLDLAERILKFDEAIGDNNAYVRCSLSRAYFSVFCIARNVKNMKHLNAPHFHEEVINKYLRSRTLARKKDGQIGYFLNELKRMRVIADYREEKIVRKKDAENATIQARECLKLIKEVYGDNYNFSY